MPRKGYKQTREHIEKLSQSHRGENNPAKKPEVRKKISEALKGRRLSEEHKKKLSESHKGNIAWNKGLKGFRKGCKGYMLGKHHSEETKRKMRKSARRGEKNHAWRGDEVGYRSLHRWVERWLGEPQKCEFCGKEKTTPKSIHWANKSGKYKRDLKDWISLCIKCHKKYDKTNQLKI